MKIIKIKKIKLILILIITILFLFVFISLLPHSCKQDSEIEHVPVLSLAPDGIISPKITFKNIRKTGTSYAIDSEGNVIIQDENGDRYTISSDGKIYKVDKNGLSTLVEDEKKKNEILSLLKRASDEDQIVKNLLSDEALSKVNAASPLNDDEKAALLDAIKSAMLGKNGGDSSAENGQSGQNRGSFLLNLDNKMPQSQTSASESSSPSTKYQDRGSELAESLIRLNEASSNEYNAQNAQDKKLQFLENSAYAKTIVTEGSTNVITPGTIIPVTLITGINTDVPGSVISQISVNIYDNATESHKLINKGARLVGKYDSSLSYAQNRVIIVWDTLIETDGTIYNLPNLISIDRDGQSGWSGSTNKHIWSILGSTGISALINMGTSALSSLTDNDLLNSLLSSTSKGVSTVASSYLSKEINRQPTITIDRGEELNVMVVNPIVF